jgi:hypothetical protein
MSVLRRHPLVRADINEAINWYEDQQLGLGLEFAAEFRSHYRQLVHNEQLYPVRFADVRRLNLDRFPYGLFYVIRLPEVWLLNWLPISSNLFDASGHFLFTNPINPAKPQEFYRLLEPERRKVSRRATGYRLRPELAHWIM